MVVEFTLTGLTSLMMHNDDVEASDALTEWRKEPANKQISVAGDDRSPAWTWQTYLYHDGTSLCLPSQNLMVALRQAGAQMILKKQKTYKEVSQSGMYVAEEFCEFAGLGGEQIPLAAIHALREKPFRVQSDGCRDLGFRLDVRRARVGQSKHVRVRPRFDSWTVTGEMLVVAPELTADVVAKLFELAGRIGLCDWRPGCKTPGPFGMFRSEVKVK